MESEGAYRRRFALVMGQKNQLWWDLPAAESFRLHQHIYRIELPQFDRTRDDLTRMLGVEKLLSQPVRELSLGERMKMELSPRSSTPPKSCSSTNPRSASTSSPNMPSKFSKGVPKETKR